MSKVYFIAVKDSDDVETIKQKTGHLLDESNVLDFIRKDDSVAIKIHFGEEENTGYVRPEYAREACDRIVQKSAKPFFTDTNTLYLGKRTNCKDHMEIARKHGFTENVCGADVIIPNDEKSQIAEIAMDGNFIKTAKIFKLFLESDAIVDISHFKGHLMTGFGGALKNIGMGCATREGKLAQHSDIAPIIDMENCGLCKECIKSCPVNAIYSDGYRVYIDSVKCIGCASCIAACKNKAIDVDWESGGSNVSEKMIEYASAVLNNKKGRVAFINFAIKITAECDCLAKDDPRISPDIGIFASKDPVSIDRASFDSVLDACGKDIFKAAHPMRDGSKQLQYASKLGLGELDYKLIEVS